MDSARTLLEGLIDFAGLFPPASLDMDSALSAYAAYRAGDDRALLGRFILPASRLGEFRASAAPFLEKDGDAWRLSGIVRGDPSRERHALLEFNRAEARAEGFARAVCDTVEMPVSTTDEVDIALQAFPESFELFLEIPVQPDPTDLIRKISGTRARAKIRTGGVTQAAIPAASDIVRFIRACSEHRVAFKATAGLHHALRGSYPLTYEKDAASGTMYGYLNVFLTAAFLEGGMDDSDLVQLLEETDAATITFDDAGIRWRDFSIDTNTVGNTRRLFAVSFGSCSFVEPVAEAKELNLI